MSIANEKQQNQEANERNESSVNNLSVTKISLNTMDSTKEISMEEMTTFQINYVPLNRQENVMPAYRIC